jgi:VWFA-related protein
MDIVAAEYEFSGQSMFRTATNHMQVTSTLKKPTIETQRKWMLNLPSRITLAATVIASLGFGHTAAAQTAPESPTTFTVTARIVVLDVVVTDKKGKLVHRDDLTPSDFTIFEDGTPQTIRSFEAPSKHRMPASDTPVVNSAADLKSIGDAPVTLLVLDELNSKFEDMSFSRQMMVKYLQAQPKVLKEPTVLMIASNTTFQQVHDYTQDRDALIEIVKKHMPEFPWRMEGSHNSGPGAVERMAQNLAALQQIAQATTGTPGRKNLIWVGNGFPSANLIGLPNDESAAIEAAIRRCTDRLLAARITMYTINPTADSTATVEADTPDDLNQTGDEGGPDPFGQGAVSFSNFAPATGGIAYQGRNDLNNIIGEGIDNGQEYYTMSYSPTNKSDDSVKFRNIRIVMKDSSLRATTRAGYYPASAADMNPTLDKQMSSKQVKANLQLDLSAALTTTIAYNGLDVKATKNGQDAYSLHVEESGVGWSDPDANGEQHAEATIAAAWYDAKGKIVGHVAREQTYNRGKANEGATFALPVTVPSNAVRLRFVVRDALNGHMGTFDIKNP